MRNGLNLFFLQIQVIVYPSKKLKMNKYWCTWICEERLTRGRFSKLCRSSTVAPLASTGTSTGTGTSTSPGTSPSPSTSTIASSVVRPIITTTTSRGTTIASGWACTAAVVATIIPTTSTATKATSKSTWKKRKEKGKRLVLKNFKFLITFFNFLILSWEYTCHSGQIVDIFFCSSLHQLPYEQIW